MLQTPLSPVEAPQGDVDSCLSQSPESFSSSGSKSSSATTHEIQPYPNPEPYLAATETSPPVLDFTEPLFDAQKRQLDALIQIWGSGNNENNSRNSRRSSGNSPHAASGANLLSTLDEEKNEQQMHKNEEAINAPAPASASTASAVLIRGVCGSGKTHLLNAFASHVAQHQRSEQHDSSIENEEDHLLFGRAIFGPTPAADREPFATIVDLVESLLESLVQWCNNCFPPPVPGKDSSSASNTRNRSPKEIRRLRRGTWRVRLQNGLTEQELPLLKAIIPYLQILLDENDDEDGDDDDEGSGQQNLATTTRRLCRLRQRRRRARRRRSSWGVASSIIYGGEENLDSFVAADGGSPMDDSEQDAFIGPRRHGHQQRSLQRESRLERFQLAIRSLIRCLVQHQPVLLILDNIQWASPDSLQIIQTLIHDPVLQQQQQQQEPNRHQWNCPHHHARGSAKINRFLFVGAYRNDDNADAIFWRLQAPATGHDSALVNGSADTSSTTRIYGAKTKKKTLKKGGAIENKGNSNRNSTSTSATVPSTNSLTCSGIGTRAGTVEIQELSSSNGSGAATSGLGARGANIMLIPLSDRLTRQELSQWMCRQLVSSSVRFSSSKKAADDMTAARVQATQHEAPCPKYLVETVYTKTGGHPFSIVQILQRLQSKGCFRYSKSKNRWEWWKDSKIASSLKSVPSCSLKKPFIKIARKLVIDKIRGMDKSHRMVLLTAAFLGSSTFDVEMLVQAMTATDDDERNENDGIILEDLSIQALLRQRQNLQLYSSTTSTAKSRLVQEQHCTATSSSAEDGANLISSILNQLVKDGCMVDEDALLEEGSSITVRTDNECDYARDDCRRFCFRHELVREAASTMSLPSTSSSSSSASSTSSRSRDMDSEDDKVALTTQHVHLWIGRRLNYCLQERQETGNRVEDSIVLNSALQLNLASRFISDRWELIDLAELNFRAAEVHAIKSSFFVARSFLLKGIRLLGGTAWTENYDLMKKMSNALTRVQYCCGELDESVKTADRIIDNTSTLSEQRIAYHTKLLCLHQKKETKATVDFILFLLAKHGHPFPKRGLRVHVAQNILRTRRLVRGWSDEELLNLPVVARQDQDTTLVDACDLMLFLAQVSSSSPSLFFHGTMGANGYCEMNSYSTLAILRLLHITLSRGHLPVTPICFVGWSWLLAQTGDFDGAQRFGCLGMRYAARRQARCYDTQAKILYHSFVAHWRLSYQDCLRAVSTTISELWDFGALDLILATALSKVRLAFICGQSLQDLTQAAQNLARLLSDYKQHTQHNANLSFFQMVSNLTGHSARATVLTGEYMDETDKIVEWQTAENESALQVHYLCSATLAFIFNDIGLTEEMYGNLWPPYVENSDCWVPYRAFLRGMMHFSLIRSKGGSRKHRRHGDAVLRQFDKWAHEGVANIRPMLLILRAEHYSTSSSKKSPELVRNAWGDAITAASRLGFIHLQALGNELAGIHFRENDNNFLAIRYLTQATALYRQWGCAGKVTQMQTRYNDILEPVSEVLSIQSCNSSQSSLRFLEQQESSGSGGDMGGIGMSATETGSSTRNRWSTKI